ncbi:hypothetical protein K7X08_027372 [Anisodus acutangulus]|uniref:Uncharacterized protein n=1 Tax=Anisodus acutangulus TaxID=402998 RepID=A0A9Q1MP71_9SOLA|nr:hypothetical protein K7X08_027372 [Anisodus acutangulus]
MVNWDEKTSIKGSNVCCKVGNEKFGFGLDDAQEALTNDYCTVTTNYTRNTGRLPILNQPLLTEVEEFELRRTFLGECAEQVEAQ